jgi:hypothetical protein
MIRQHRPDAILNMEKREARYGSRFQFAVQTLYAYMWMPPRELRISVELGFQKPINRGL